MVTASSNLYIGSVLPSKSKENLFVECGIKNLSKIDLQMDPYVLGSNYMLILQMMEWEDQVLNNSFLSLQEILMFTGNVHFLPGQGKWVYFSDYCYMIK